MFLELHERNPPASFHKIYIVPRLKGKVLDDNTLPERNLSSIENDSALKIDLSKFLKTQLFYQF